MGGNSHSSPTGQRKEPLLDSIRYIITYIHLSAPYQISVWVLYRLVRRLYVFLQAFWWLFNGVTAHRRRVARLQLYEKSAHVQRVVGRYKCDPVLEASGDMNFVTIHESFVNPSYVLKDNVTLYYATKDEAGFVEVDDGIDVMSSDTNAFMRLSQFSHARKLIVMPMASFHRLAEHVGDTKAKLILVHNTARCGSTVLCQMFEQTDHVVSLSEADALNQITFYSRRLPEETVAKMLRSTVRILCKPRKCSSPEAFVFKTTASAIWLTPIFTKVFPDAKLLFMFRDGAKTANSLSKASVQMPLIRLIFLLSTTDRFKWLQMRYSEYFTNFPDHPGGTGSNVYMPPLFIWTSIMRAYMDFWAEGYNMPAVKYEHLIANPLDNMKIILGHCDLPLSWAEPAVRALSRDSQRNSPLSMKNLQALDKFGLTYIPEYKAECDWVCSLRDVPYDIPKPWIPEGTMTVGQKDGRPAEG